MAVLSFEVQQCAEPFSSVAVFVAAASAHSTAQHQLQPVAALKGAPALELALRKLDTVGNFMMTTAHPDDENNAMLAYFSHGKGFRTSLVTATHGEGGQNEIGPELFVPLAVLRTEELVAAHRFDGAEQFFTRAIDFGFSFSVEETLEKWGHDEILGDFVRHDPHHPSRRDRRLRVRRRRRRPASPGLVATDARSVPRGGGSGEVPGADQGRPAPVAAEEVLLHRRLRARPVRRRPARRSRRRARARSAGEC